MLGGAAVIAGGLVLGFHVPTAKGAPATPAKALPPNACLRIGHDDTVTVLLARSEMGQCIWTGRTMTIAEDLECDWAKIRSEHAAVVPVYYSPAFAIQMTGGS